MVERLSPVASKMSSSRWMASTLLSSWRQSGSFLASGALRAVAYWRATQARGTAAARLMAGELGRRTLAAKRCSEAGERATRVELSLLDVRAA
jgi:hypothetical protein